MCASSKIRAVAIRCIFGSLPVCFNSALMTTYHKLNTSKHAQAVLVCVVVCVFGGFSCVVGFCVGFSLLLFVVVVFGFVF